VICAFRLCASIALPARQPLDSPSSLVIVIVGQGCLTIRSSDGRSFAFFETDRFRPYGVATIVGHDEDAVPLMRRFDASSRNVNRTVP